MQKCQCMNARNKKKRSEIAIKLGGYLIAWKFVDIVSTWQSPSSVEAQLWQFLSLENFCARILVSRKRF